MPKRFSAGFLEQYYTRRVVNEVDIARHLGPSLSVCYLYEAYEDAENVNLVMELCRGRGRRMSAGRWVHRRGYRKVNLVRVREC